MTTPVTKTRIDRIGSFDKFTAPDAATPDTTRRTSATAGAGVQTHRRSSELADPRARRCEQPDMPTGRLEGQALLDAYAQVKTMSCDQLAHLMTSRPHTSDPADPGLPADSVQAAASTVAFGRRNALLASLHAIDPQTASDAELAHAIAALRDIRKLQGPPMLRGETAKLSQVSGQVSRALLARADKLTAQQLWQLCVNDTNGIKPGSEPAASLQAMAGSQALKRRARHMLELRSLDIAHAGEASLKDALQKSGEMGMLSEACGIPMTASDHKARNDISHAIAKALARQAAKARAAHKWDKIKTIGRQVLFALSLPVVAPLRVVAGAIPGLLILGVGKLVMRRAWGQAFDAPKMERLLLADLAIKDLANRAAFGYLIPPGRRSDEPFFDMLRSTFSGAWRLGNGSPAA